MSYWFKRASQLRMLKVQAESQEGGEWNGRWGADGLVFWVDLIGDEDRQTNLAGSEMADDIFLHRRRYNHRCPFNEWTYLYDKNLVFAKYA